VCIQAGCALTRESFYERGATNIFHVYVPEQGKVVRTANVEFDESRFDTSIDDAIITDPDEDNGYINPTDKLYSTLVSTSSGGEKVSIEELATVDESEHNSDSEHGSKEPEDHAEDFIDTGMPEPGAQSPIVTSEQAITPTGSIADESESDTIAVAPRHPEPLGRSSRRERTMTNKALANDA
jgi:hypothetical protein